jgi:hypothetical protein
LATSEKDPLKHLAVTLYKPEQATGLLANYFGIDSIPDFFKYDHYVHIFLRLAAKALTQPEKQEFKKEISTISNELAVQGKSLQKLFSLETFQSALNNYLDSRDKLIEELKDQELQCQKTTDLVLVDMQKKWITKPNPLNHYILMPRQNKEPRVLGSKKASYLNHFKTEIPLKIKEVVNEKMYTSLVKKAHQKSWEEHFKTGDFIGSPLTKISYSFVPDKWINTLLLNDRKWTLNKLTQEIEKYDKKSLLQLLESNDIQRISPQKRSKIQGDFIEVAYKIQLFDCQRFINFIHHKNTRILPNEKDLVNPIHTRVSFPLDNLDNNQKIEKGISLTQEIFSQSFDDLFSFSLVKTYQTQNEKLNGLKGHDFLVLSKDFNQNGLKQLQSYGINDTSFHFENKYYTIKKTMPDGACGLHALLGTIDSDGFYYKENIRDDFVNALKTKDFQILKRRIERMGIPLNQGAEQFKRAVIARTAKLKDVHSILSDFSGLLISSNFQRKTSFVTVGETQSSSALNICPSMWKDRMTTIAWKRLKEQISKFDETTRLHYLDILHATTPPEQIKKELDAIFPTIHMELRNVLKEHGLRLEIPKNERGDVLWGAEEDLKFMLLSKTFDDKFSEIVSRLIARKWIVDNNISLESFQRKLLLSNPIDHMNTETKDLYRNVIVNHLDSAVKEQNISSLMVFPKDDKYRLMWLNLKESKNKTAASEVEAWMSEFKVNEILKNKVIELAPQATSGSFENMEREAIISKITDKPASIIEVISLDMTLFLSLVAESTKELSAQFDRLREENLNIQSRIVFSEDIFSQYVKTIAKAEFFFNTDEIELAAHLFNKKAQVFSTIEGEILPASFEPINKNAPGDTIAIYHEGDHFWRCDPLDGMFNVESILNKVNTSKNDYDLKLKTLLGNYQEFLLYQINGTSFTNKNNQFLANHFKNAKLLQSLNPSQLPLIFPNPLLEYIDKSFRLRGLTRSKIDGYFVPYYKFDLNQERHCYELSIEYHLASKHDQKEYCGFVVAQFGTETVDAFREKHPKQEDKDLFYNEFLIQAMYAKPEDNLKLPGIRSFRILSLSPETVIPIEDEKPFEGIYLLLNKYPDERVRFNNERYEKKELAIFGMPTEGLLMEPGKDFYLVDKMRIEKLRESKETIKNHHTYKKAQEDFLLLESILKLTVDENVIPSIRGFSPDIIINDEAIVDLILDPKKKPADPTKEAIDAYLEHPTVERKLLEGHLANLLAIQNQIDSKSKTVDKKVLSISDGMPFSNYDSK